MKPVENLQKAIEDLISDGVSPLSIVVVEESPDYPGELVFQVFEGESLFYSRYRDWVSCYLVLNEMFNLPPFLQVLDDDGWTVIFAPNTAEVLRKDQLARTPLSIEGYDLHPFQQYTLNHAFDADYWFFNWATGAGKSFTCAAGAKELFARDGVDVVIACTLPASKINQSRFFAGAGLDTVVNDGSKPKRKKVYAEGHQVYVMNYEKLNFDAKEITALVSGRRVLWIFDEVHKLVSSAVDYHGIPKYNMARRSFEKMIKACGPDTRIWPMSASVVNGDPLRYRDVHGIGQHRNPLGGYDQFGRDYSDEIKVIDIRVGKTNKTFPLITYDWNLTKLQNVRHRVGSLGQTARKTDPGIAPYFKGLATIVEPIQITAAEREIHDAIIEVAYEAYQQGENMGPYYSLLRYTSNTPLALLHTHFEVAAEIAKQFDLSEVPHSKIARLNEQLESIREAGDQVLVFTHYTNLGLHLIEHMIEVPHVIHSGEQSDKAKQQAQDEFKANPDITCFLTSDAGTYGLNMQNARYCIQLEPTYSYDEGMQRASRIDRADSHLDGLTNYVYCTEDSVEERVWAINQERRNVSAIVQGTQEVLSHGSERGRRSEAENMAWMLFGDRA